MLVRFWMTESPVTIKKNATLFQLLEYTHQYKARRFPVVEHDKLVGIISISDLYRIISPRATRAINLPEKYKAKLAKHHVSQIMISKPISCAPNDNIEDVAAIMRERKIGALPVLKDEKIIGIITESDILQALIKISGGGKFTKRISLVVTSSDKSKEFYAIVRLCEEHQVEVLTILNHPYDEKNKTLITLRISGKNTSILIDKLWQSHHQILSVK